jgi:hypothetical protein
MWRPVLIVVGVILIDLIVVRFGERQYIKMTHTPITREDVNDPAKPQLYDFDARRFQLEEAAEVYRFKIAVAVVIFTTIGIFAAGKQSESPLIRSILLRIAYALIVIECLLALTTAVLLFELYPWHRIDVGWHSWLIDRINGSWFGFLLLRMSLLFLATVAAWLLWRRSRRLGAAAGTLAILGLAIFVALTASSPAGVYGIIDEIERWPDEDHYWRFEGGKFEHVSKDGVTQLGHYEKTADGWILTWADSRYRLRPSWFGISQCDVEFPDHCSLLGRRLLPFLRPASLAPIE